MLSKALKISLKHYKVNPIIRTLILSDFMFWSAGNLISPIFAVFVVDGISGGSIEAAGFAATLFLLTKSLAEIPFGMILDKTKTEIDDLLTVVVGGIIQGVGFLLIPSITSVGQLFLLQIFLGLGSAAAGPGWYSIFTKHIDKKEEGFEWGLYDVLVSIGMAITAGIGGYLADKFGFDLVFYLVGVISIFGSLTPLLIKNKIRRE